MRSTDYTAPFISRRSPKQDGLVYRINFECGKVYIAKQGDLYRRGSKNTTGIYDSPVPRPFLHTHRDQLPSDMERGQFYNRDPHWYRRRVKEAIHIRFQPQNINSDQQRTAEGTATPQNNRTTTCVI